MVVYMVLALWASLGLSLCFFFSSRRRHTRWPRDWSSDVCSSDLHLRRLIRPELGGHVPHTPRHDDEEEHPGPGRDRRRRLGALGLEGVTRPARERVDEERNASTNRLSVRQTDDRDTRPVANGERDHLHANRSRILDSM